MPQEVYVIGAGRTDFKRNFRKEGKSIKDIIVEAGRDAIKDAGIEASAIQSGIVGNFAAGLFTRQLHLGAYLTDIDPALLGIPTFHTEAACASGSVGVLAGAQQIMAGLYDVVIVVGAEQQKTMSAKDGGDVLGAAGDYAVERPIFGDFMFPKLFGRIAQIYGEKYGLTERQLSAVAYKNYAHAAKNPLAQMRDANFTFQQVSSESEKNPQIAPPLKLTDCSQITDGGAAIILASASFAKKLASSTKRPLVKLMGFGQATDHLTLAEKDAPEFSVARKATKKAFAMAGMGPRDLSAADVHDCFSITEIVATEVLGLAESGQAAKLIETGATALPSVRENFATGKAPFSIPINPGGGLIADGHPVGATGVRQVGEAYRHLTETAGERQVAGARRYATFNMGGSITTSCVMIYGREG